MVWCNSSKRCACWRLDMQRGVVESLAGVRHQWMMSSWMWFAAEWQTHQTCL